MLSNRVSQPLRFQRFGELWWTLTADWRDPWSCNTTPPTLDLRISYAGRTPIKCVSLTTYKRNGRLCWTMWKVRHPLLLMFNVYMCSFNSYMHSHSLNMLILSCANMRLCIHTHLSCSYYYALTCVYVLMYPHSINMLILRCTHTFVYIFTHTHTNIYSNTHTLTYIHTHTHTLTYIHTRTH